MMEALHDVSEAAEDRWVGAATAPAAFEVPAPEPAPVLATARALSISDASELFGHYADAPNGGADAGGASGVEKVGVVAGEESGASASAADALGHVTELAGGQETVGAAAGEEAANGNEATARVRREVAAQVNQHVSRELGTIDELNDLESYWEDNGVKADAPSYGEFGPDRPCSDREFEELSRKAQEENLTIASLESGRLAIVRKARADARLALENLKSDVTIAVLSSGLIAGLLTLAISKNIELATIISVVAGAVAAVVAEYALEAKARAAVQAILDKAKQDLKAANTTIKLERMKLDSMKRSLASAETARDAVKIKPFKRPNRDHR